LKAHQQWPAAARRARADLATLKVLAAGFFAVLSYIGLTGGALGPAAGPVILPAPPRPPAAVLHFHDGVPVITGTVAALFQTVGTFVGPNEGMKQDRLMPDVDVLALTKSFDAERTRIAALEAGTTKGVAPIPATSVVADASVPATPIPSPSARPAAIPPVGGVAVASVDPSAIAAPADTAALNAIDSAAAPAGPMPGTLPQQLAYARDDAPATTFPNYLTSNKYSAKDLNCLAQAIYFEARGEPYRGQVAVAQVVMNRLAYPLYPKTICGVVFQDASRRDACQFSFACDGIPEVVNEPEAWKQAEDIAQKVADGELYLPEVGNATHYHATYVYPDWAPELKRVTKIGQHIFYKFRRAA
jgi:spore germination cell wall hydrolase CwlJ-like protein